MILFVTPCNLVYRFLETWPRRRRQ